MGSGHARPSRGHDRAAFYRDRASLVAVPVALYSGALSTPFPTYCRRGDKFQNLKKYFEKTGALTLARRIEGRSQPSTQEVQALDNIPGSIPWRLGQLCEAPSSHR